jgi:hypothetical protein
MLHHSTIRREASRNAKSKSGKASTQVNRAAMVYSCNHCTKETLRRFYTVEAANTAAGIETGTPAEKAGRRAAGPRIKTKVNARSMEEQAHLAAVEEAEQMVLISEGNRDEIPRPKLSKPVAEENAAAMQAHKSLPEAAARVPRLDEPISKTLVVEKEPPFGPGAETRVAAATCVADGPRSEDDSRLQSGGEDLETAAIGTKRRRVSWDEDLEQVLLFARNEGTPGSSARGEAAAEAAVAAAGSGGSVRMKQWFRRGRSWMFGTFN